MFRQTHFFLVWISVTYQENHTECHSDSYVILPEGRLNWLLVWNMIFMTFHILGIIIPTDELIFFGGVGIPPTRLNHQRVRIIIMS